MRFSLNQKNIILEWAKANGLKIDMEKHDMIKAYNDVTNDYTDIEISNSELLEASTQADDDLAFMDLKMLISKNPGKIKFKALELVRYTEIIGEREVERLASGLISIEHIYQSYYSDVSGNIIPTSFFKLPRSKYTYVLDRVKRKAYLVYLVSEVEKLVHEMEEQAKRTSQKYCELINSDDIEKQKVNDAKEAYSRFWSEVSETGSDVHELTKNIIALKNSILHNA